MARLFNTLLLISLLTVVGCNDDEAPRTPANSLMVEISAAHSVTGDIVVFVTDSNGEIVDERTVKAGSLVMLRMPTSPDKGNLTICYPPNSSSPVPSFYTITGLHQAETITIDDSGGNELLPPATGLAKFNIQNCNDVYILLSDGIYYGQAFSDGRNSVDAALALHQPSSRVLVSAHKAINEPMYGWVDNVVNGGAYPVDFNTFSPYPKTIAVSFDEYVSAYIAGRNSGDAGIGYVMANRGFAREPKDPSVAKFGYMDGYDQYTMSVSSTTNKHDYYHVATINRVVPSLPDDVIVPDNTLSIENGSISDFRFTYSSAFTFSIHQWYQQTVSLNQLYWTVYSDEATVPPIKELPKQLADKYRFISWEKLKHMSSEFRTSEDDYTYREFIRDTFENNDASGHNYSVDAFYIF